MKTRTQPNKPRRHLALCHFMTVCDPPCSCRSIGPTRFVVLFSWRVRPSYVFFFFFNDTATTEIYTLSLHDALPISGIDGAGCDLRPSSRNQLEPWNDCRQFIEHRSEEHTSELQSLAYLVCRLLLEKKKKIQR